MIKSRSSVKRDLRVIENDPPNQGDPMESELLSEKYPTPQQLYPMRVQREQGAEQLLWPVSANHQVWQE